MLAGGRSVSGFFTTGDLLQLGQNGVGTADIIANGGSALVEAGGLDGHLVISGGLEFVYAGGVVFHLWETLRFQNAVWHSCVLVASALFYVAVLDGVVLA